MPTITIKVAVNKKTISRTVFDLICESSEAKDAIKSALREYTGMNERESGMCASACLHNRRSLKHASGEHEVEVFYAN